MANGDGGAGRAGQSQAVDITVREGRKTDSAGMAMTGPGTWYSITIPQGLNRESAHSVTCHHAAQGVWISGTSHTEHAFTGSDRATGIGVRLSSIG